MWNQENDQESHQETGGQNEEEYTIVKKGASFFS